MADIRIIPDDKIVSWVFHILRMQLPRDAHGDTTYAQVRFLLTHRRLPSGGMLFNDVLFRLRVSPEMTGGLRALTTDKVEVKSYVRDTVGEAHNVPTVAVLTTEAEVDAFDFPPDCCIKPTHMSARVIVRRGGEPVNRKEIKSWLGQSYYEGTREPNYRDLAHRVIVEPIIFSGARLVDYKIYCVNGEVRVIWAAEGLGKARKQSYFRPDWTLLDVNPGLTTGGAGFGRPRNLDEMMRIALKLAEPFAFVRVDMYSDGDRCLIGELTHCDSGAMYRFESLESEILLSEALFGTRANFDKLVP